MAVVGQQEEEVQSNHNALNLLERHVVANAIPIEHRGGQCVNYYRCYGARLHMFTLRGCIRMFTLPGCNVYAPRLPGSRSPIATFTLPGCVCSCSPVAMFTLPGCNVYAPRLQIRFTHDSISASFRDQSETLDGVGTELLDNNCGYEDQVRRSLEPWAGSMGRRQLK